MKKKFLFPAMLSLEGKRCLIIGAGKVGERKLGKILQCCPGEILILDIVQSSQLQNSLKIYLANNTVTFENRSYTQNDLLKSYLVCAATNNARINMEIAIQCKKFDILCNCASNPSFGSFIMPAQVTVNNLSLMISTDGCSPALAKKWVNDHKAWLENKETFLNFIKNIRNFVLADNNDKQHEAFFNKIIYSSFEDWFMDGDHEKCLSWLKRELPCSLHKSLEKIFNDFR